MEHSALSFMDLLVTVEKAILSVGPRYRSKVKYLNYCMNWQDIVKTCIVPKELILLTFNVLPAGQRVDGWEGGSRALVLCAKMIQNVGINSNNGNNSTQ